MTETVLFQRHFQRRGTAALWTSVNPILASGEWGVETDLTGATPRKYKLGDGVTAWTSLPYCDGSAFITQTITNGDTTHAPSGDAVYDAIAAEAAARDAAIAAAVNGLSWKQAVRVATDGAGTLASSFENGDTVDGVVVAAGDRILIKNQSSGSENGIYVVQASGAPVRALDANSGAELVSASVYVSEGTTLADTQWVCTTNSAITLGSTSITFAQLTSGGGGNVASDIHAASSKATPVDADELGIVDSAASNVLKKLTFANLATWIGSKLGPLINAATGKTTPVDADEWTIADSAASSATKKVTGTNLKAYLKTYFDTLYAAIGGGGSVERCFWDYATRGSANMLLTAGLLKVAQSGAGGWFLVRGNRMRTGTGKYYFECKIDTAGALIIGITTPASVNTSFVGNVASAFGYRPDDGLKYNNNGSAVYGGITATTNDIIGCAIDFTNSKIYWAKNNTWMNSGDPAAGTNAAYTTVDNTLGHFPSVSTAAASASVTARFKAADQTYSPPSGFSAWES